MISDFWHQELWEDKFLLFLATTFVVVCYISLRKPIHSVIKINILMQYLSLKIKINVKRTWQTKYQNFIIKMSYLVCSLTPYNQSFDCSCDLCHYNFPWLPLLLIFPLRSRFPFKSSLFLIVCFQQRVICFAFLYSLLFLSILSTYWSFLKHILGYVLWVLRNL